METALIRLALEWGLVAVVLLVVAYHVASTARVLWRLFKDEDKK